MPPEESFYRRSKKAIRRSLQRLFFGIDRRAMVKAFRRLGLGEGDTVCVHTAMRSLGYIVGGPNEIIEALMETVGPEGCIMMPSFPIRGSMASYLDEGEVYDVRETPSRTGVLPEIFRRRTDVHRSLHPTNPLAAWGRGAEELLRDHDRSLTPFGYETPYGRLVERDRSYILMLGTHIHSLLHHLQERVEFPNLFLDEERVVPFVDADGIRREMRTKVMRPRVPYFIAIPSAAEEKQDWAILHDFALMFPRSREREVRELGYQFGACPQIPERRKRLERDQILRATRLGRAEIGLHRVKDFIGVVEPDLRSLIEKYRTCYDIDEIIARDLPYS